MIKGYAPKGGISCERGANNEESIGALDDTITAAHLLIWEAK